MQHGQVKILLPRQYMLTSYRQLCINSISDPKRHFGALWREYPLVVQWG